MHMFKEREAFKDLYRTCLSLCAAGTLSSCLLNPGDVALTFSFKFKTSTDAGFSPLKVVCAIILGRKQGSLHTNESSLGFGPILSKDTRCSESFTCCCSHGDESDIFQLNCGVWVLWPSLTLRRRGCRIT